MRVSSQYKFIFLGNPKCGSTSIDLLLQDYSDFGHEHCRPPEDYEPPDSAAFDDRAIRHVNADQLKVYFDDMKASAEDEFDWDWDNYYKFTTVRNPWKKMISYYFFLRPDKDNNPYYSSDWDKSTMFKNGFNSWLKSIIKNYGLPHYEYFCLNHETGEELVDDVFKLEEIDETLPPKLKELGLDLDEIPVLAPDKKTLDESSHLSASSILEDYYSLYNDESKEIISKVYSSDIAKFNYSFGD